MNGCFFADVKPQSVRTYNNAIKQLFKWLKVNEISNPMKEDLIHWRDELKASKSASTVNSYLTAAKLFFGFLDDKGLYHINLHIKGVKINHEHKRDPLTAQQGKFILESINTSSIKGKRDKAMIALMMCCGLRTIELVRANVNDLVESYGRTALYVQGKGRDDKAECVMIPPKVLNLIKNYLNDRQTSNGPLFSSLKTNQRLTTRSIRRIVKEVFLNGNIDSPRISAHSLRHTAATQMLLNGVELVKVQQVLRHKNINTTLIYSHHLDRLKNFAEDIASNSFF